MTLAVDWDVNQETKSKPTRYPDKGFESSYMKSIMQSFPRQRLTFQKSDARLHISLQEFKCCLTADPGVASSIPARSHTFVEIDHEIISTVILLPSADSFKKGCCQLQAKVCAQITG